MSPADDAVALVVGGSGGIGRAVVDRLVVEGWRVAFTFHGGAERARQLEASVGPAARAFALDLRAPEGPGRLVAEVESNLGAIGALVNAAGVQRGALLAMTSDGLWEEILEVNLAGPFRCCRAVLRGMVSRRSGAIVNVASLSALRGVTGLSAYAAAKAGLLALTRSLAREVGPRGIRVNAVIPGFVPTAMTASLPEATVRRLRAGECLPEGTGAASVADAVSFLLSSRASSITGQELIVDAGASA